MFADSGTIYKLTILYMLNKLDSQLTRGQLSNFFVKNNYTDSFHLNNDLSELVDSKFIECVEIRNTSYFSITPDGYETLAFFKNQIPKGMLADVDRFIEENKMVMKNEVGTISDYYRHTNGDYICNCKIMEGKSLLYEINLSVPTEEEAIKVCGNWQMNSEEIYSHIMKRLLR